MNLKLQLPAVKYMDVPPGRLFTTSNCRQLFAMTFEGISSSRDREIPVAVCLNGDNYEHAYQEVGSIGEVKRKQSAESLMRIFGVQSEHSLMNKECYLVAIEESITEIKN
jgi:hypothetical protein